MPMKSTRPSFKPVTVSEALAAGLEDLAISHCLEVEPHQDRFRIEINWSVYLAEERRGLFKAIGAWCKGEMVGYAAYVLQEPAQRRGSLWAYNRGLFLAPDFRGHGPSLIAEGEAMLKRLGVGAVVLDIPETNSTRNKRRASLEPVMARLGFDPYQRAFMKVL